MSSKKEVYPGLFVAVEGPDGAGKTTAIKKIADELNRHFRYVKTSRMIGGNPFCEEVREKLLGGKYKTVLERREAVISAFKNSYKNIVGPERRERDHAIVLDRWYYSTLIYQGLYPHGFKGREDLDGFREVRDALTKTFELDLAYGTPDILIVLDPGVEVTLARIQAKQDKDSMDATSEEEHVRMTNAYRFVGAARNLGNLTPGMIIRAKTVEEVFDNYHFQTVVNAKTRYWY